MEKKIFKVSKIKWDVDNKSDIKNLPKTMTVEVTSYDVDDITDEYEVEDFISDYITDEIGFCHDGFEMEEV